MVAETKLHQDPCSQHVISKHIQYNENAHKNHCSCTIASEAKKCHTKSSYPAISRRDPSMCNLAQLHMTPIQRRGSEFDDKTAFQPTLHWESTSPLLGWSTAC